MVFEVQHTRQSLKNNDSKKGLVTTWFINHLRFCKTTLQTTSSLSLLAGIGLLSCIGITPEAHSAIYYLSPNGRDSNPPGSSDKPWQTFAFTIPKLQPGDTLILKDGTYDILNSGYPDINCSSGAKNGTSANPITIKAENERRAFLNGKGQWGVFRILNCSYWKIEGLRGKSKDNPQSPMEDVFYIWNSRNLVFKRLLVSHNNRYGNTQLMVIYHSSNILVEESEFYSFHRHAIELASSNNCIMRRNYSNSKGYANISGGYQSSNGDRGQAGLTIYPGSGNIAENNISEGNQSGVSLQASESSSGNKLLGNISVNDFYGVLMAARGTGNKMPIDTIIENLAVVNPAYYGIFARGTKNTNAKNISIFGGASGIVADYEQQNPGDGFYSFFSKNALVNNVSTYGIYMINQTEFSHKFTSIHEKPLIYFSPNFNYFNESTQDQELGTCKVFIPQASPLKGKGEGGADIGANILYRYENGVLTNQPLWNIASSDFPHGALVSGVNDIAGSSAFDVHKRLNVNTNGCTFTSYSGNSTPDSGGSDTVPPAAPTGMTLTLQ